ncbi:MAG TPA: hypothetical protein VIU82_00255 [Bosea sp. (in: a-proteobacteria)]
MAFSAYNALGAVHVLDLLAEQHRNRVRQGAQQSDAESAKVSLVEQIVQSVHDGDARAARARRNPVYIVGPPLYAAAEKAGCLLPGSICEIDLEDKS